MTSTGFLDFFTPYSFLWPQNLYCLSTNMLHFLIPIPPSGRHIWKPLRIPRSVRNNIGGGGGWKGQISASHRSLASSAAVPLCGPPPRREKPPLAMLDTLFSVDPLNLQWQAFKPLKSLHVVSPTRQMLPFTFGAV